MELMAWSSVSSRTKPRVATIDELENGAPRILAIADHVGFISLSEVRFDGQARPQEQGRKVVVRASRVGAITTDLMPKPFNVRTRVHEYSGSAWTVALGVLYFSNFAIGRRY
jgi:hypothetical protein